MESSKFTLLVVSPPHQHESTMKLLQCIKKITDQYFSDIIPVSSAEQYEALSDKYTFDVLLIQMGTNFLPMILKDQSVNSQRLKWVSAMSAGIDGYIAVKEFRDSQIPLTNAKGNFSQILGEFVALGVLYHAKHLERFMERKAQKKWEIEPMEVVSSKTMVIVGYGDIGAACAKIAKNGFGMNVIGIKRNPNQCTELQLSYCSEIVGNDQMQNVIPSADYVVSILPKTEETVDFINIKSTFSLMKPSGIFMNIGRGPTVKEDDLVKALKEKMIAGAVLDVFTLEPLPQESELWSLPNILITPHCADRVENFMQNTIEDFGQNIIRFSTGDQLNNLTDKQRGY